jgi:GH25 family lysozyme M1 (1,4-beta-N-acetylmuramidase)/uncharacterized protein YraI
MTNIPGIDVSRWEGEINWPLVAEAGYRFAVIRATVGDYYTDPSFYTNWNGAYAAGLLVTAYHVVVPNRYASAQTQRFFDVLGDRRSDLPLVLDVERVDNISPAGITACVLECNQKIQQKDSRNPIIYTAKYYWKDNILPTYDWSKNDLWIANYLVSSPSLAPGWTTWKFWQYDDKGKVNGVSSDVDLDWFNGSYADLISYSNQNPPPIVPPIVPPSAPSILKCQTLVPILNIRNGPGINYSKVGELKAGEIVTIKNISGYDAWVQFDIGKWCAAIYGGVKFLNLAKTAEGALQGTIDVTTLNIRNGPGTSYQDIGDLHKGNVVSIKALGGKNIWVEIETGKWSAFYYGGKQYMTNV